MTEQEPQVRYFGPPALRKPDELQVPAPLGQPCLLCGEAIEAGDTGTINLSGQVTHYECGMRMAVGSIGHQKRCCSCYGGSEEDPPGMTFRQAAVAAVIYFHFKREPAAIAVALYDRLAEE